MAPAQEDHLESAFASRPELEADRTSGPEPASKAEAEEGGMQEEALQMYQLGDAHDFGPRVDIQCFGVETTFIVDTGAQYTGVSRSQMVEWGQEDQLYYDQTFCFFDMKVRGRTFRVRCDLHDYDDNLIGLDLLYRFNCVVDFSDWTITFRHFADNQLISPDHLYITVAINGHET